MPRAHWHPRLADEGAGSLEKRPSDQTINRHVGSVVGLGWVIAPRRAGVAPRIQGTSSVYRRCCFPAPPSGFPVPLEQGNRSESGQISIIFGPDLSMWQSEKTVFPCCFPASRETYTRDGFA